MSELGNLCAMSVLCSTCSFPVLPPLLQCHPHLVNGPCIALCTIVCARCTLQRAQRAHRPAHKPVLRPPEVEQERAEVVVAVAIPPSVNFYPLTRDHGGGGAVEDLLGHDGGGQVVTLVVRWGSFTW